MKTQNEAWGFYGTVSQLDIGIDPELAWEVAMDALIDRGVTPEQARDFLDSRYGRHVADHLSAPDFNINDALLACLGSEQRLLKAIRSV